MIEKYGFVYIWFDRKRKMYYIGCHWGPEQDGYICSSDRMREAYRRRPQDFRRRILKTKITDKSNLLEEEYYWLSKIKNEDIGKRYYNLSTRHFGHWMMNNHYEKKHHPMYGKNHTEETKQKMRGRKVSSETKQRLSEISKKHFSDLENRKKAGIANVGVSRRKGTFHTEEAKKKMSVTRKGRIPWNKGLKTGKGQKEYKMENIE